MVLTDREFLIEWWRYFGSYRGARLLGWLAVTGLTMPAGADRAWVMAHGPLSSATRYRNVRAIVEFMAVLEREGKVWNGDPGAGWSSALDVVMAA
jgi:hypothetical protein